MDEMRHCPMPGAMPAKRKKDRMRRQPFEIYAHKMVKMMFSNRSITRKGALVMSSFIHDFFERLATEAGHLVRINHMQTMSHRHVLDALKLVVRGSLAEHAIAEAHLALGKFGPATGRAACKPPTPPPKDDDC
ncbi:histone H2B [Bemisia tabaci]|nr:PREDICTED: histone H2B-like [Bemisia tabaci]